MSQDSHTLDDRLVGTVIGRYRVKQALDRGGMGAVYLAEHLLIGKPAVIKLLRSELSHHEELVARFFNEAKAASAIRHPGVIEVFDFGHHSDGRAYIVMEYLDGHSLAHRLRLRGRLPEREAAAIARSIASVLDAAHACGIVHRDLKPDNIFLVPDSDTTTGERVKVLDFGIAKLDVGEASKTRTGALMGTPRYMSPEQARGAGSVDARADLYSLGCILYHMIAGRPPFIADGEGELIAMHLYKEPRSPREYAPEISDELERATMALLVKDPDQRTQSARDAVDLLGAIVGAAPVPVLLDAPVAPTDEPDLDAWFTDSHAPSRPPPYESIPPPPGSRAKKKTLMVPAIGALAAMAMVAFALVRSVSDDGDHAPPSPPPTNAIVQEATATPAPPPVVAPPPVPAPVAERVPAPVEPPPVVAEPEPAHVKRPVPAANRRPAARPATNPKPTTSSPNGSPLEPTL